VPWKTFTIGAKVASAGAWCWKKFRFREKISRPMWKLSIEDDQGNKTVVSLVRDEYTIGRAEDNTVRLTERNISRHHAKLNKNGSSWLVGDMNSYNGCFVNGVRVSDTQPIEHGDLVQLGDYRLEVHDETAVSAAAGVGTKAATVPSVPRSQSLLGQPDRLVMLAGPTPGSEFALVGERMVIGRGEECDISINHSSVSRIHAEIHALGNGRYELIDRESANGVRINGSELKQSLIDARDSIELGDVILKFIPAGQIYRAGADESQQIPSLRSAGERPSPAPGVEAQASVGGVSSGLKLVGALLGLGLLVVLGMVIFGAASRGTPAPAATESPPLDHAARALADAKALLDKGDLEAAHLKAIGEIPEDSNARQSQEFREIESRWADMLFDAAAKETDSTKKRAVLDRIAKSTTVDSVRRKRAANEIAQLDAEGAEGVDVNELPSAPRSETTTARPVASAAPKALPGGLIRTNPFGDSPSGKSAPKSAASPPAGNVQDDATSGDRQKVARAKAILQAKAQSGRATEQELRMLRALCRQLGDSTCSN
jgi:ABC transport system ATP-binding/permease protein